MIWAPAPGFEVDAEIAAVCDAAVRQLAAAGTEIIEVERIFTDEPLADWFTHVDRLLRPPPGPPAGHAGLGAHRPRPAGPDGPRRDHVDAVTFAKAIDSAHTHNLDLVALFDRAPLLLCPATAGQTAEVGHQGVVNGQESQFALAFTGAYNLTRNPAGTVCAGFTADGMPVGLQVVGPQHADVAVMRAIAAARGDPRHRPRRAHRLSLAPAGSRRGERPRGGATTVPRSHHGRLAQLVRALPSHGRGQRFESSIAHHEIRPQRLPRTVGGSRRRGVCWWTQRWSRREAIQSGAA